MLGISIVFISIININAIIHTLTNIVATRYDDDGYDDDDDDDDDDVDYDDDDNDEDN